ncbi:Os07g0113300 [Oryza sativa Japonica Group]|uniref:Uncharacterized protein n=3 Tax=Oryza TaxID=4527 RepID=A0A0P0X1S6_ORYSJ|nr:uncharacterized protein LOC107276909 [Oryza sativa Japonica Group]KAB8104108.1 hypothetical protein EE612_036771 [Oryza sativa]KAF2921167.1 hypothetical protein DAI22_07g010000 [Oryza sativa Japonica Group]KAF2921168.1 hypothetical protein DAI22_07g010000 [Oryza sativa Japonica Group]BAC16159.1 hypothetical protein [Oryza sativa Japonica Group]BAC22300.1 hypothetical protein [Oryza sativa Japonica Group]
MALRSVLAGRLMVAANRAFRGRPVSTTTKERLELKMSSYPWTQNAMDNRLREGCAMAVDNHNRRIMRLANPYSGPADGDILYNWAWSNNISFLIILCSCFGLCHAVLHLPHHASNNVSTA